MSTLNAIPGWVAQCCDDTERPVQGALIFDQLGAPHSIYGFLGPDNAASLNHQCSSRWFAVAFSPCYCALYRHPFVPCTIHRPRDRSNRVLHYRFSLASRLPHPLVAYK